jgi:hypothetical protein
MQQYFGTFGAVRAFLSIFSSILTKQKIQPNRVFLISELTLIFPLHLSFSPQFFFFRLINQAKKGEVVKEQETRIRL